MRKVLLLSLLLSPISVLPTHAHASLEQQILKRCNAVWRDYGASKVTRCYKKDIEAVSALNRYGKQHHSTIRDCIKKKADNGYSEVKQCTDKRIAAGPTLPDILNTVAPWFIGVGFK